MAHEIETMLYVGQTPWHRLGVKLDAPPTAEEAIKAAGLDWEVGLKPLYTEDDVQVDHNAIYRVTDGKILGVGGPAWRPLQNRSVFDFFNPFLEANEATIECAGSLSGGKRIWALAKIQRDPVSILPGDDVAKYVLLSNPHTGSEAVRVGFTPVRVVCANTLAMAIGDKSSNLIKVHHTKNAAKTLEDIREVMNLADRAFEATAEQYRALARRGISDGELKDYVKLVFAPAKARSLAATAPVPSQAEVLEASRDPRNLEIVKELFERGVGSELPSVRGTFWGAYNAVTEYVTHHRGRDAESRLNAQFGDGATLNRRALDVGLQLASS